MFPVLTEVAGWGGMGAARSGSLWHAENKVSSQSDIQVDLDNMVGIISEPGVALLCQLTLGFNPLLAKVSALL